jgi:hypothetical protein
LYIAIGEKEKAKIVLIDLILADEEVRGALSNHNAEHLTAVIGKYINAMNIVGLRFNAEDALKAGMLIY